MSLHVLFASVGLLCFAAVVAIADDGPAPASRVYELRTYTTNPGRAEALHKRFRDHTNRIFEKHGIGLVGYWVPQDEKDGKADKLIYMISFPSRDAAKASWAAFQADPEWQKVREESHKDGVIVNKVESVYLTPTDYSPAIKTNSDKSSDAPRVFELRTYTASPGKLDDLNKRFRDHTMRIFESHGMTNIGYWTPMDEDKGKGNTLVYILAFPNRQAATKSWKAFRDDPAWQKVAKDSQPDGVPLAAKVESIFMDPTDYSPIK
jgi:uncharacterized protein (DUF1330 family)